MQQGGTLYIVATPIGNMADISARMRETLERVSRIACEDTRHSGRLLAALGISKPLVSFHEHNESERVPGLVEVLAGGEDIALISDAGTPLVSDPGFPLVRAVVEAGLTVCPIPGPSAAIAALSVSALPPEPFRFLGFPPRQGGARRKYFQSLAGEPETLLLYESIHRLGDSLADLADAMGPDRPGCVARELTKRHEQVRHGSLSALAEWAGSSPEARKGEAVIVVGGAPSSESEDLGLDLDRLLLALGEALPTRKAAEVAAKASGLPKNRLYTRLLELKK